MKACKYSEGASGSDAVPSFRELLLCAVLACLPYLTLAPGVRMDLQKLLFCGPGFMLDGEAAFLVCSWGAGCLVVRCGVARQAFALLCCRSHNGGGDCVVAGGGMG